MQECRSVSHSPIAVLVGAVLTGGSWGPGHWRWCRVAAVPEGLVAVLGWQLSHIADVLAVVGLEALHDIFGDSSPFLQGAEQGERSQQPAQPQPQAAGLSPGQGCLHRLTWKLPLWVMNSSSKFLLGLGIRGIRMTHTLCRRDVSEGNSPRAAAPSQLPHTHRSMRTSRMTRTSRSRQEAMGTTTVRIPNQCSHSSTVPGESRADTDPQAAHHHGTGLGLLHGWPWHCSWQGSAGNTGWRRGLSPSPAMLSLAGDPVLASPVLRNPWQKPAAPTGGGCFASRSTASTPMQQAGASDRT